MKRSKLHVTTAMSMFLCATLLNAQVIEDTHISLIEYDSGAYQYQLVIKQDAAATDFTCNDLNWNDGNDVRLDYCLDEGAEWFVVKEGDEISAATTGVGDGFGPFPNFQFYPRFSGSDFDLGSSDEFLIAVATPVLDLGFGFPDAYGWARLRVVPGVARQELEMVDNAIVYERQGILAGTHQVVPEPESWFPLMTGLLVLRFFRR